MTASIVYQGNLRCSAEHLQSGSIVETDAPTDNRGKGERFSPTDTVCLALGTCIITTMAIRATDMGLELKGSTLNVTKHMLGEPRRIGGIDVEINLPELAVDSNTKELLEKIGNSCPVARSLNPEMKLNISYNWSA